MKTWKKIAEDYGKAFLASLITAFLILGKNLFDLNVNDWKAVVSAAVASWLPILLVALNPRNTRYGVKNSSPSE